MDAIEELGELAIASRMRRLSDRIMKEGVDVYKSYSLDFDPGHFPVYYYLSTRENGTVTELATGLQMSHPAIIKIAKALEKRGLVTSEKDSEDGRKRVLSLTGKGKNMLPKLQVAWSDIALAVSTMLHQHNHHLLNAIQEAERAFDEANFIDRVKQERSRRLLEAVKIVEYQPRYGSEFKQINYDWIAKYFTVEDVDKDYLENHKQKILDKGGAILFAKVDGKIVGTCALLKLTKERYELAKMGVKEGYQGKEVGKKLGFAIIERARKLGCKVLYLDSNKSLAPAIGLYKSLGFQQVNVTAVESEYARCNIRMEMNLPE